MNIEEHINKEQLVPVQDRKDKANYWHEHELFTYDDIVACLESLNKSYNSAKKDFTSDDIGLKFKVVGNNNGHGFEFNQTVTLIDVGNNGKPNYFFKGFKDCWYCDFYDVELK